MDSQAKTDFKICKTTKNWSLKNKYLLFVILLILILSIHGFVFYQIISPNNQLIDKKIYHFENRLVELSRRLDKFEKQLSVLDKQFQKSNSEITNNLKKNLELSQDLRKDFETLNDDFKKIKNPLSTQQSAKMPPLAYFKKNIQEIQKIFDSGGNIKTELEKLPEYFKQQAIFDDLQKYLNNSFGSYDELKESWGQIYQNYQPILDAKTENQKFEANSFWEKIIAKIMDKIKITKLHPKKLLADFYKNINDQLNDKKDLEIILDSFYQFQSCGNELEKSTCEWLEKVNNFIKIKKIIGVMDQSFNCIPSANFKPNNQKPQL